MDTTTIVVILIFTLSIISGVTGKKDSAYNASSPPANVTIVQSPSITDIPGADFSYGDAVDLNSRLDTFIRGYARQTNRSDAPQIADAIANYAKKYNVNPRLLAALIARESRFNKYAVSSSNAQGLGQLLPSTASGMGVTDPFDIDQNVMGTARYFRYCLNRFASRQDQIAHAIAGYLEGPGNVERNNGYKSTSSGYVEDILKIYQKI